MSEDLTFLERLLDVEPEVPTYETPWGRARPLTMDQLREWQSGRRLVTKAELCVMLRDLYEAQGADPGRAMRMAVARVRRDHKRRVREQRRTERRAYGR
jgi:hypothetical protein